MKKKLLLTAIPIIISIVGTIYFQVDWIKKSYKYEFDRLNKLADESLKKALLEIDLAQEDSIGKVIFPKFLNLADTVGIEILNNDSLTIKLSNTRDENSKHSFEKMVYNVDRVKVEYTIDANSSGHDSGKTRGLKSINERAVTDRLDEIVLPYLKTQDSLLYKSDSIKIQQNFEKNLSAYGVKNMEDLTQLVFQSKVKPLETQLSLGTFFREYKPQGLNRYIGSKRWVGVYFHSHADYILSKMLLGVCSSVFLMLIMIVCFIYLVKLILKQKRLAEMKDDFINNLTHEFKTPIATIAVAIEGMQNFNALNDPEKTNRYLQISKNELSRLNSMVTNVLNSASQEKNRIELTPIEVDLRNAVQEIIDMEYFRTAKPIRFNIQISDDVKTIKVDVLHFKNVLTNLIDNAVKYSGETVEITIVAENLTNKFLISIKDNGIGIPASELKYVFDKFYRVSNGNIYNVKGIGLGLSYVKSIIELHNGTIAVKSEMNVGTEFRIFIPLN
ncbi:MAG: HAMP domain-containing histidine kinase [Pedobacter sp.]|nr:MAG: HAMP domain-containing histidine kinase [Pedobacter sp.]